MHPEALNEKGGKIFPLLKEFGDFYLAGGTALALQIGHRISVDFDLFSGEMIDKDLLPKVKIVFSEKTVSPSVNNRQELTVFVDGVKITFLQYPFPLVDEMTDYGGVKMLGIKEIAATKAYTIGRRGSLKDYVDLYFILDGKHVSLGGIVDVAEKKYNGDFNSRLFLEQLIYLDDIEDAGIIFLKNKITREALKDFFADEIKKIEL